jgi:hypothetical protein
MDMVVNENGFTIVTLENIGEIAAKLAKEEGKILVAEPGPESWEEETLDVEMFLFAHPLIDLAGPFSPLLYSDRGSVKNCQTGWQQDREYILRPKRKGPSYFFPAQKELDLKDHEFLIGFLALCATSFLREKGQVLYFGDDQAFKKVFVYGLKSVVSQIKEDSVKKALLEASEHIADYAIEDLKIGKVFNRNVAAGIQADAVEM